MAEFDDTAFERVGYPDRVDLNQTIWSLYGHLGDTPAAREVERRVADGSIFDWLANTYDVPRPAHAARFVDYLQRAWGNESYGISDRFPLAILHAHCVEALQQSATPDYWRGSD